MRQLVVLVLLLCGLEVYAVSPAGEILHSTLRKKVMVEDKNNRPVFSQQEFYGSVPELSPIGTPVMTLSTIHADKPASSAMLLYYIVKEESIPANATDNEIFMMPWFDGKISTMGAVPGREVVKAFRLRLKVSEQSGNGLPGEAVAIINVTDINNHVPKFSPTSYHMTAVENSIGDIGRVSVTDGDEPGTGNWEAKYSISDDPHGYFSIRTDAETNQGILSVVKPLDFETVEELTFTLHVENINPLSSKAPKVPVSKATVTVTVVNENDAPYFTEDPIKIVLPENVLPGTSLKRNIAVDPENVTMRFEIIKDPEDWIEVDEATGEISAKRRFDTRSVHISNRVYTAGVKVTDAGGLYTTATVQITLVETNDFAPQLSPLSGSICKDNGTGLVLTAVDKDLAPHAAPFLFAIPWTMSTDQWNVTRVNNTHTVLQPGVDLPSGVYQVTVMVSDSGTPPLNSTTEVNVTVCKCDASRVCQSAVVQDSSMGIGIIVVIIITVKVASSALVWLTVLAVKAFQQRQIEKTKEEVENPRDNVVNYSGGGAEIDTNVFSLKVLSNPNTSSLRGCRPAFSDLLGTQAPPNLSTYSLDRRSTEGCKGGLNNKTVSIDLPCTPNSAQITHSGAACNFPPDPADTEDKNSLDLSLPSCTSQSNSDTHSPVSTGSAAKSLLAEDDNPDPTTSPPHLRDTEDSSDTSSTSESLSTNGLVCELLSCVSQNLPSATDGAGLQAALTEEDVSNNNGLNLECHPDDAMCALAKASPAATEGEQDVPLDLDASAMAGKQEEALPNIEDSINKNLETANRGSNVPSFDVKQIYNYEGGGSATGSLSSIYSSSSGGDRDFDYLNEWGPQFQKLADLYISHD